jgi:hypothetical protein
MQPRKEISRVSRLLAGLNAEEEPCHILMLVLRQRVFPRSLRGTLHKVTARTKRREKTVCSGAMPRTFRKWTNPWGMIRSACIWSRRIITEVTGSLADTNIHGEHIKMPDKA